MSRPRTLAAPGTFDPLSALQVQRAGVEVAYVGSYALSTSVGQPDVGWLDLTTLCARPRRVLRRTEHSPDRRMPKAASSTRQVSARRSALSSEPALARSISRITSAANTPICQKQCSRRGKWYRRSARRSMRAKIRTSRSSRALDIADVTGSPLDALERMLAYLDAGADAVSAGRA